MSDHDDPYAGVPHTALLATDPELDLDDGDLWTDYGVGPATRDSVPPPASRSSTVEVKPRPTLAAPTAEQLQAVRRFDWERIVRRCGLPCSVKLVAFIVGQHASTDGTSAFPGVPKLAATTGMSARAVERHLATLRDLGLIERVANGGGRKRRAAEYRLTVPDDLPLRVSMLGEDELTPDTLLAGVLQAEVQVSPATVLAGDMDGTDAIWVAGDSNPLAAELPPSGTELPPNQLELPPKQTLTPANDPPLTSNDAQHQQTKGTSPLTNHVGIDPSSSPQRGATHCNHGIPLGQKIGTNLACGDCRRAERTAS